jgi:pimeloyl-ACP methyl ester carboxylesterase
MRVEVNGIGLEVEDRGSGPPVMLLHGWPDSHRLWRHQVEALAAAGFRTIAPDLRGFGESDRPTDVEAYALPNLAGDVLGLLDHFELERAHLIGHDWGAALAWAVAAFAPDRVDHLAVLSVGHPASFRDAGFEQREKSWYMLLFQFEGIAEEWLSADGFANFRAWGQHPEPDAVIPDLTRPGALTASLNWYRANVSPRTWVEGIIEVPPVSAPTLGIWSSGDIALTESQMTGSPAHVTGPWRYERLDDVGHWMQLEQPETVSKLLLDFLE